MVDFITRRDDRIPSLDHSFVHVFDGIKDTDGVPVVVFERQEVRMVKMRIGREEDVRHHFTSSV